MVSINKDFWYLVKSKTDQLSYLRKCHTWRFLELAWSSANNLFNRHQNIARPNKSDKLFKSSSSQRGIPFIYTYHSRQWLTQMVNKSNESLGPCGPDIRITVSAAERFRGLLLSFRPTGWLTGLLPQTRQTLLAWFLPAVAGKAGRPLRILGFACLVSASARRACGWMEEAVRAGKGDDVSQPIEECFVEFKRRLYLILK